MTVKEAISVLKRAKEIRISWNGSSHPICKDDPLQLDAFGNYVVDEIESWPDMDGVYDIVIAMTPVKVG